MVIMIKKIFLKNLRKVFHPIGNILSHNSESRGQEEVGHTQQRSVLFIVT